MFLAQLVDLYSLVVLVAVIGSWTQLSPHNPVGRIVYGLTEPVLEPIRRVLPPMGGIDFSPLLLLFGLRLLRDVLV